MGRIKKTGMLLLVCCLALATAAAAGCKPGKANGPASMGTVPEKKHLILDAAGNYGGTLDLEKYGEGAPLNGEYDHIEAGYYAAPDYYGMKSTESRTILPEFRPCQQTMADTDGIACVMMAMNYSGDDVVGTHTELALLNKYESLTGETVCGNGTTVEGLSSLLYDLGYECEAGEYAPGPADSRLADFVEWITGALRQGQAVLVRFQDGVKFGWHVIIGIEEFDTFYGPSTVMIMADPCDGRDHWQDGYNTISWSRFFKWWFRADPDGLKSNEYEYIIVSPKKTVELEYGDNKPTYPDVPALHLMFNADGSYGGSYDAPVYGDGVHPNGETDHYDAGYYVFPDYYNMRNTSSRKLLYNYRAHQQTMKSSCGVCAVMSALDYYGYKDDMDDFDEFELVDKYELITGKSITGVGIGGSGLRQLVNGEGYDNVEALSYKKSTYVDRSSMLFPEYADFLEWVTGNLDSHRPMICCCRIAGSGHWETIFGIDTMGTDYIYDDVIFLADSWDTWDHYQDGYNTMPAATFYGLWFNGKFTYNQQHVVFWPEE